MTCTKIGPTRETGQSKGNSDHLSIVGSLDITPPPSTHPSTHPVWTWSWNPESLEALRSDLAVTELLPPESNTRNCDDLWAYWRDTLLQKAHLYCTSLRSGTDAGPHKLYPRLKRPWMTDDILQSIKRKHKLHRTYLKSHRQEDWTAFKIQRNLTTEGIRHAKSSFVQSNTPDANKPQTNRKNLYSFMKCLKRPLDQTYRTSNIPGKHSPHHSTKLLLSMTSSFRKVKNPLETRTGHSTY